MPDYVSQEVVDLVENHNSITPKIATELLDKNGNIISKKTQDLVVSKQHINGSVIAKRMIKESSVLLKQENSNREVSHTGGVPFLDREFDDAAIFETIDALAIALLLD